MANRIVGNVYIVDSALGNSALPWLGGSKIGTVMFWSSDTTGALQISGTDTTNVIFKASNPVNLANTVGAYLGGSYLDNVIKIPTLTAGTAFLYLL